MSGKRPLPIKKLNRGEKKKLNYAKNKAIMSVITVFLMLSVAVSFIAILPQVDAQTVTTTRSFIFVGVSPKVVGVGQEVIIVTWTSDMPPDVGETDGTIASPNGRAAWNNPITVTVTKPDGSNETVTMPRTDPVGATWYQYVPQDVGTYTLQAYFPGEWKNTTTLHRYYQPDFSATANLTVLAEPTPTWQETPLPTDYWNRPLNSANHDWYVLAGNWLGGAATNYPQGSASVTSNYVTGKGTETPHILWTKQYYIGGLMDENYGAIGYETTQYGGINWNGIALNGYLHYTPRITSHGNQGWQTVDLYTGEEVFLDYDAVRPSFGQVYNYESPNQHGGFSYLWRTSGVSLPEIVQIPNAEQFANGSVVRISPVQTVNTTATHVTTGTLWEMLDGYTMKTVCYIANVTSGGTAVYGKDGSILRYNLANDGIIRKS